MCNETRRQIALGQMRDEWSETRIPLRFPEGMPNWAPLESIRITDTNAIIRASPEGGAELVQRRWSWPGPTGKPVYNFRSEGRNFETGRCLIVADGFYEFTKPADAKAKRKNKWLFTKPGENWFCIAGIWRSHPEIGEAFTMLTAEPGPDIALYHSRQIIVLERADYAAWLNPATPARELLKPSPAGTFNIERATA